MHDNAVACRRHGEKDQRVMGYAQAKEALLKEVAERTDWRMGK
jgi:hypothetical protein